MMSTPQRAEKQIIKSGCGWKRVLEKFASVSSLSAGSGTVHVTLNRSNEEAECPSRRCLNVAHGR